MKRKHTLLYTLLVLSITLAGCTRERAADTPESVVAVSGAKSSVFASLLLNEKILETTIRPSSPLGMYVSLYLGQGMSAGVYSALEGIDVQVRLLRADSVVEDETFALLQEYGTVLQVNIIDALNRSTDRQKTLDGYLTSLAQMNSRMTEKQTELEEKLDDIGTDRKAQRQEVRTVERDIKAALREKDYVTAGPLQQELALLEAKLAEIESKEKQTKKVLNIVEDLLDVGGERLEAITQNREILIAGLQIIDVPGIEELGIVIDK